MSLEQYCFSGVWTWFKSIPLTKRHAATPCSRAPQLVLTYPLKVTGHVPWKWVENISCDKEHKVLPKPSAGTHSLELEKICNVTTEIYPENIWRGCLLLFVKHEVFL